MNERTINEQYKYIVELIEQKRLKEALTQLESFLWQCPDWELRNRLEQLQTSYNFMLQYMKQGIADPERKKLYIKLHITKLQIHTQLMQERLQQMLPEAELLPVLQIIPIALSIPHVFRNLSVLLWSVHLFHNSDDLLFSYSEDSPSVLWQPPSAYQVLSSVLLLLPHLSPENTR